jgi:hypothetical protein
MALGSEKDKAKLAQGLQAIVELIADGSVPLQPQTLSRVL